MHVRHELSVRIVAGLGGCGRPGIECVYAASILVQRLFASHIHE